MYHQAISQSVGNMKAVEVWLDKAEAFAAAKKMDVEVLNGRLAPDMKPLIYQIQSASDYVKGGAAWLSGQKPPRYEDDEQTIDELRTRIRKTVAFVESVKEKQYEGADARTVSMSFRPGGGASRWQRLLATDGRAERVFSHLHGLRHPSTPRRRRRQTWDSLGSINWIDALK